MTNSKAPEPARSPERLADPVTSRQRTAEVEHTGTAASAGSTEPARSEQPVEAARSGSGRSPARGHGGRSAAADRPLLGDADAKFQARWQEIKAGFVDGPRHAVEEADELLARLTAQLTEAVAARRDTMRGTWQKGDGAGTEELRVALQDYRRVIDRLLHI